MKLSRRILILFTVFLAATLLIAACSEDTQDEADEAGAAIETAVDESGDVVEEAGEEAAEDIEEGAEEVEEDVEEAGEEAAEDIEEAGEDIKEASEEVAEDIEDIEADVEADLDEVGEDLEEAGEEAAEDIEEGAEEVEEDVEEAGEDIEEAGEEAGEEIEEAVNRFEANLNSFLDSLRVNINAELDEVGEDIEEAGEEAAEDVEEAGEEVAEDVEEASEDIEEAGEEAAEDIEEGAEDVEEAGEEAAEDIEEAGEDVEQEIDEIAEESDVNLNSFQDTIFVTDQAIVNDTVVIEEVEYEDPGFVVIHADNGEGSPGEVIGHLAFDDDEMDEFSIEIDRAKVTSKLYVMLHEDSGEAGVYEFGEVEDTDGPVEIDGDVAVVGFNVYMIEPAEQTYSADNNTLTLDTVVSARNTWVVVYSDEDRENRIGMTLMEAGRSEDVVIDLDADADVGDTLWIVLHDDTGEEGEFEFDDDDEIDDPIVVNLDEVRFSLELSTEEVDSDADEED